MLGVDEYSENEAKDDYQEQNQSFSLLAHQNFELVPGSFQV
jgi:hypothetical protein